MSRALPATLLLAPSLTLAGCAPQVGSAEPEAKAAAADIEDPAEYYLAAICPANDANDANWAALQEGDLEEVTRTAADARAASEDAADLLRDSPVVWPADVIDDLPIVADSFAGDVEPYDEMSRASSIEEAAAVQFPDITEAIEASKRVRGVLGLPEDTAKGC